MGFQRSTTCDECRAPIPVGANAYSVGIETEEVERYEAVRRKRRMRHLRTEEEAETPGYLSATLDLCGSCLERPITIAALVRTVERREQEAQRGERSRNE